MAVRANFNTRSMRLACVTIVMLASCGINPFNDPYETPDDAVGFMAVATSESTVSLSWQVVEGAYAYMLERKSGVEEYLTVAAPMDVTFDDAMLKRDTEYSYRLRVFGLTGQSPGVEVTVRTLVGTVSAKSSFELIEEALAGFLIDRETATRYKAFALFRDPRLPSEYQGTDTDVVETNVFDEILTTWASTSPAGQEILQPFLVPPAYVGSWASPAPAAALAPGAPHIDLRPCNQPTLDPNWAYRPFDASGNVKVWYDTRVAGEVTRAQTLVTALETEIWPRLIGQLGMRAPLSDAAIAGCNGGDGRLDVYLTDMATMGQGANDYGASRAVDWAFKSRPAFLLINHNLTDKQLKATAAHELFHSSQWAYPVAAIALSSYPWLKEATAHWAIDYVYPTMVDNFEQGWANHYLETPDQELDVKDEGKVKRIYGSYMFFQFIARTTTPSVIKNIWDATVSQSEEIMAVDTTIPGGFEQQWPKFAKLLWNQDPVDGSSFASWDALTKIPTLYAENNVSLNGQPSVSAALDGNSKHLSIQYYRFKFADPQIRSVGFANHLFAVNNVAPYKVTVQAFYKKVGSIWEWEHWSDGGSLEQVKSFCLDVSAERLDELVVVISNDSPKTDVQGAGAYGPRLALSNVGCWRFEGTSSVTTHTESASTSTTGDVTADATVMFERAPPDPMAPSGNTVLFWVKQGAMSGSGTAVDVCTTTQSGAGPTTMLDGSLTVNLGLELSSLTGPGSRDVFMYGNTSVPSPTKRVCPGVPDINSTPNQGWSWLADPVNEQAVVLPSGKIQGNNIEPLTGDPSGSTTVIWNLTPLRQP